MPISPDIQVDFSGGQINERARRRADLPYTKNGGRVQRNFRARNTGQLVYRPGRTALYPSAATRGDYFRVSTGEEYQIRFAAGGILIVDATGATVASNYDPGYVWGEHDVTKINWAQAQDQLFICYPAMQPQIATWDRTTRTWSFAAFTFDSQAGIVRRPYFRQSVLGATMSYSGVTGSVTLTCSQNFFTASMIGKTLSIVGEQVTITAVASPTSATATPAYRLPDTIKIPVVDVTPFQVGQIVSAVTQNIKFEVGYVDAGAKYVHGIMLSGLTFQVGQYDSNDTLVSPLGSSKFASPALPAAGNTNLPTVQWQEEFMNDLMGWPGSVSFDRGRLIFCDFPQSRNAILWSAIAAPQTFWIDSVAAGSQPAAGANANAAILDLVSAAPYIRFVIGWQQGQFAFTDRGTFFIPISNQNPLIPGSPEFDKISDDGIARIRPVTLQDAIIFVNAGQNRVSAVRATGSYSRPMIVEDVSDAHTDLFSEPIQIAIATGDGPLPERYIYVLNTDGSLVVGKVLTPVGQPVMLIGWAPEVSSGPVEWITASGPNVFYTTQYSTGKYLVEKEDPSAFFDFTIPVNAPPAGMTPPGGKGLFWHIAGQVVSLMDGYIDRGDRPIDANGNIVPFPGEDLSSPTLMAGVFSPAVYNPFVYGDNLDRQKRINIDRVIVNVRNATDFIIGRRTFSVSKFGDDAMGQPTLLQGNYRCRFLGRTYDPTIDIIKHRPGPIEICELTVEASN